MRLISDVLEDLAKAVEPIEEEVLERCFAARAWVTGWKVWEWRRQAERIDSLKNKNRMLVDELKKLQALYRAKTGKEPPGLVTTVLGDDDGVRKAMDLMREALHNLTARRP